MEEIGYKQGTLAPISAPRCLEHRAGRGIGERPGRNLRPHRRAARLHAGSSHHADVCRAAAGFAVWPRTRIRLPGALPDGRRRWPAGLQPAWSRWSDSDAWPHRRLPAFLSLCGCAGQCALPARTPLFLAAVAAAGLASLLILAAGATWLALLTHAKFSVVFAQSVAPFLPGDAIKILAAAACVSMLGSFGSDARNRERTL